MRNKYYAKKVVLDGIEFDSRKEAGRYCELKAMQQVGIIHELRCHPKFELIPKCGKERAANYHADFAYIDLATGKLVVEDVKSRATKTRDYILRRKLMNWRFNIQVREV